MRGVYAGLLVSVVCGVALQEEANAQDAPFDVEVPDFDAAIAPDEKAVQGEASGTIALDDLIKTAVYAVSKRPQLVRESPGVASVISQEQARIYGWASLNDVLYRQPGFAPSRDYERRVVAARGQFESWNNNHLLMLIDGVPFNDDLYGSAYTWEITPLELASAIEIVRGPSSALYGGNATNGVINIRTPTIEPGETLSRARAWIGTDFTQHYHAIAGEGTRHGSAIISVDHYATPGNEVDSLDGSGRMDGDGDLQTYEVQDERNNQYVFAKVSGNQTLPGLSLQLHYQRWRFETGHGWLWESPDTAERMVESRQLAGLSYHRASDKVQQEYVLRFQRHAIDWRNRYFSEGNAFYPGGVTEELQTHTQDVFTRAQFGVDLPRAMHVLGGVEYTGFLYTGDEHHVANIDMTTFAPYEDNPSNELRPQGAYLGWIDDHPVHNVGSYLQLASGRLLGRRATATIGARYDRMFFDYNDLGDATGETSKSFQQFSPRVALVLFPTDDLSVKLLAGRGFRAPAPSELFGANTFALASNLAELRPETIQTFEAALDWALLDRLIWRVNGFHREFDDQIAYSVANFNLSTNVYSNTTIGAETEVLADLSRTTRTRVQGFGNYSLVRLLDETINDETIMTSEKLAWAPEHVGNVGINVQRAPIEASTQVHVQGPVRRRLSDRLNPLFVDQRPVRIGAWATLDARLAWRAARWAMVGLQARNLLDTRAPLIKNNDYPFDYETEGRQVLVTLDLE